MTCKNHTKLATFWLKPAALLGALAGLAACSVADPLTVRSTLGAPAPASMQIAMAMPEGGGGAPLSQMASALKKSFETRGMQIAPEGKLIADYALAVTPATIGVQRAPSREGPQNTIWISPPRLAERFDECEAMELRGTLLLINRETSEVSYRGKARTIDCEFGDAAITALADGLVADYIAKAGR